MVRSRRRAAFVAVVDNLSFRLAASRIGVTPSALNHTMRTPRDPEPSERDANVNCKNDNVFRNATAIVA